MKKENNKGFMLAETLIVTTFVAGVLIFLFMQFSKLNNSYSEYYNYNDTESLYALEDVKDYIKSDTIATDFIDNNISESHYIDLTDCSIFTNEDYCLKLLELENINKLFVFENLLSYENLDIDNEGIIKFLNKINNDKKEGYRLVGQFDDGNYATVKFIIE